MLKPAPAAPLFELTYFRALNSSPEDLSCILNSRFITVVDRHNDLITLLIDGSGLL